MKKYLILYTLILFSTLFPTIELHDLRGLIDSNDEIQLFYRVRSTYGWSRASMDTDLKKLDVATMLTNVLIESHSFSDPMQGYASGDIFYDYVLNDDMGLTTINCGRKYVEGFADYDTTFIRINTENVAVWDDHWGMLNIKRSNINSSVIYATYEAGWDDYRLINSIDGGLNWSSIENAPPYLIRGISPFDDQLLFLASPNGNLYRSDDGLSTEMLVNNFTQLNWTEFRLNYYYTGHLHFIFDQDELHIYAIVRDFTGNLFHFVRSDDNGFYWEIISTENSPIFIDLDLSNSGVVYKGIGPNIFKSTDFGETYTLFQNLPYDITGLYQVDNTENLYVITELVLYEVTVNTITPLINYTSIEDENNISENSINLNNHPNPFNPSTTIEFSIKNNSIVELSVYNVKGQNIKILVKDEFTKGSHSVIWNGENEFGNPVSSGVYFYKLKVDGNIRAVKKCLLLK